MTYIQPRLPLINSLNVLTLAEFGAALRPLFEAAGPLAEALYAARPYASYEDVIQRAESLAAHLPVAQQIEIVNAHPRIGDNAAVVRSQSSLSYHEQGYDRETDLPTAEVERVSAELADLNRTYEDRFGFRFVVFVNQRPKSEIVDLIRDRLHHSRESELETALRELFSIARDRCKLLAEA
jgi:2-oxo-4-hydroxy-4-carboxy--5-ureidoimidazoline (OHCU) decarboxylase